MSDFRPDYYYLPILLGVTSSLLFFRRSLDNSVIFGTINRYKNIDSVYGTEASGLLWLIF